MFGPAYRDFEELFEIFPNKVVGKNAAGCHGTVRPLRSLELPGAHNVDFEIPRNCSEKSGQIVLPFGSFVLLMNQVGLDNHAAPREKFAWFRRFPGLLLGQMVHLLKSCL